MPEKSFFHPLESTSREQGLKHFLALLPKLEARMDSAQEKPLSSVGGLKVMHRIMTHNSANPWPEEAVVDAAANIMIKDNPFAQTQADRRSATASVETKFRVLARQHKSKGETAPAVPFWHGTHGVKFSSSVLGGKASFARFTVDMRRRGAFRKLGTRENEDGSKAVIPANHVVEVFDRYERASGEPEYYLGMLDNVESLITLLYQWRDRELPKAQNLDEYLGILVYFSIMGAKVIHPFFDGNGRAFEAQMIKDLRAIGYPIERMPYLEESENLARNALEGVSNEFLFNIMETHRIPFIPESQLARVQYDPDTSKMYTQMLSGLIRARIMSGMPKAGFQHSLISAGVDALKMSLSRDVGEHMKKGEQWGPPTDSPFAIGPEFYEAESEKLKEAVRQSGAPVRIRE